MNGYDERAHVSTLIITKDAAKIISNIMYRCQDTQRAYGWEDKRTQDAYSSALTNLATLLASPPASLVRVMADEPAEYGLSLFCAEHALGSLPEAAGPARLVYGLIGHTVWSGKDEDGRLVADPHARKWAFHS